jgi:antitoxin ParD1/3/4
MTVEPSISLTDERNAFARRRVESGRHASLSAAPRQGLDLLRGRIEADEAEPAALKALLTERGAGPFAPGAEMDARIEAIAAERRRALAGED